MDIQALIQKLATQRNPQMGSKTAQEFLQVINSNDSQRGAQIAEQLCKTYGVTPEEAVRQARQFFHI